MFRKLLHTVVSLALAGLIVMLVGPTAIASAQAPTSTTVQAVASDTVVSSTASADQAVKPLAKKADFDVQSTKPLAKKANYVAQAATRYYGCINPSGRWVYTTSTFQLYVWSHTPGYRQCGRVIIYG